jgi:RNA polymerase sigma-70 factor (ECF subfamily)
MAVIALQCGRNSGDTRSQRLGLYSAERDREERFRALYDAHYWRVLAYAVRRTNQRDDAHEAVAEVFSIAWRRFDDIPEGAELPWLYGVARRVLANQRRAHGRWTRLLGRVGLLEGRERSEPGAELPDHFADIRAALTRLNPTEREILLLTLWEGLSQAEVGEMLGLSENAVAIRAHRARRKLRAAYEHETGTGGDATSSAGGGEPES